MKKYFLVIVLLLTILAACSDPISENEAGIKYDSSLEGLTYNVEEQAWSPQLADVFKDEALEPMKEAYEIAIHHGDLLSYMPCYCGCYEMGHESNRDCFVEGVNDGIAEIDQMGFG
ncbi:hypothetical protein J2R98_002641 [Alkalibacillus filiformis]|nr:hypothetical protein [Alkalibacillus filiformis]